MIGKYTALVYVERRLDAIPVRFDTEEDAIGICTQIMRETKYYRICLYDPTGKLIANYGTKQ